MAGLKVKLKPGFQYETSSEPGNVLIWSGEDNCQDTLLSRLLAHGADVNRVYFINTVNEHKTSRCFDPARDLPKLSNRALELGGSSLNYCRSGGQCCCG